MSSLLNPQRDLADARTAYGISVSDILLAPTLAEAWGVIAPMLTGCTPVGANIDDTLGLIDFELKRLGQVTVMPLGVDLPRSPRTRGTALDQAMTALAEFTESGVDTAGSTPFGDPPESLSGHLVTRSHPVPTPTAAALPALSALLEVSRQIGPALLGEQVAAAPAEVTPWIAAARHSVAAQLRAAATRVRLTEEVMARLRAAQRILGVEIIDDAVQTAAAGADIDAVLVPGARVCFTGTAQDAAGREVSREQMMTFAEAAGLVAVKTVTKTRCEVLVTAEAGTQSGKARKAHEFGKPVISADEFLAWVNSGGAIERPPAGHLKVEP